VVEPPSREVSATPIWPFGGAFIFLVSSFS